MTKVSGSHTTIVAIAKGFSEKDKDLINLIYKLYKQIYSLQS